MVAPLVLACAIAGGLYCLITGKKKPGTGAGTKAGGGGAKGAKAQAKEAARDAKKKKKEAAKAAKKKKKEGEKGSGGAATKKPKLMTAAKTAGGRRVAAKKKNKPPPNRIPTTKGKLKEKVKKRTGGVDPNRAKAQLLPSSQGSSKTKGGEPNTGGKEEAGEKGEETYSMGYTYTTTVTDARVQAVSGKHKALLAKKIPTAKKN